MSAKHVMLSLGVVACVGASAHADFIYNNRLRTYFVGAALFDNGQLVGSEEFNENYRDPGLYEQTIEASVQDSALGSSLGRALMRSDMQPNGFFAQARADASGETLDPDDVSDSYALSLFEARVQVEEPTLIQMDATISWAGDPEQTVIALRESSGAILFALESDGESGTLSDSLEIMLMPGITYEATAFAYAVREVSGLEEGEFGEYDLSVTIVPAPASLGLISIGCLSAIRRRR